MHVSRALAAMPEFRVIADGTDLPVVTFTLNADVTKYDVFDLSRPGKGDDKPSISLFRARVENGVMRVPAYEDAAVIKLSIVAPAVRETGR